MGISNEIFQIGRNETPECQFGTTPNNVASADGTSVANALSGIEKFAFFMRFLALALTNRGIPEEGRG